MEFDDSSNHFISHYYHVLIIYMGHVLNKISAYGLLLQLIFLYDNLNGPTIPWSVMSIEAFYHWEWWTREFFECFAFRHFCSLSVCTLHLVFIGRDKTTINSVVTNVAITYMLCVQLVHQVYCFSTWTGPKLMVNNDLPPTCLLKKAPTINCNLNLPVWPNLVSYPDPE